MIAPFGRRLPLVLPLGLPLGLLAAGLLVGCGVQQRAAESLIDPQLRGEGVLVERQRGMRDLDLGRYRVRAVEVADEAFDGSGPLAPDADGRTRPTSQLRLSFVLEGGAERWTARCVGQRRQPPDADLAAVADEQRDEVAMQCELSGGEQRWVLQLAGDLGNNIDGRLAPAGRPDAGKRVEVIMWRRLWNVTRRRLPAALVLIRDGQRSESALILDAPERAWLEPSLDDAGRELVLTASLAIRLMPIGFGE